MKHLLLPCALLTTLPALAHEGHGLTGAHGHASDGFGLVLLAFAVVAGAVAWLSRK